MINCLLRSALYLLPYFWLPVIFVGFAEEITS